MPGTNDLVIVSTSDNRRSWSFYGHLIPCLWNVQIINLHLPQVSEKRKENIISSIDLKVYAYTRLHLCGRHILCTCSIVLLIQLIMIRLH